MSAPSDDTGAAVAEPSIVVSAAGGSSAAAPQPAAALPMSFAMAAAAAASAPPAPAPASSAAAPSAHEGSSGSGGGGGRSKKSIPRLPPSASRKAESWLAFGRDCRTILDKWDLLHTAVVEEVCAHRDARDIPVSLRRPVVAHRRPHSARFRPRDGALSDIVLRGGKPSDYCCTCRGQHRLFKQACSSLSSVLKSPRLSHRRRIRSRSDCAVGGPFDSLQVRPLCRRFADEP